MHEWLQLVWCLSALFCRSLQCLRNCQGGGEGELASGHPPLFRAGQLHHCWAGNWWSKAWIRGRGLRLKWIIVNKFENFKLSPTLSWSRNWDPERLNDISQFPLSLWQSQDEAHSHNCHPCFSHCACFQKRRDWARTLKNGRTWMGREDGRELYKWGVQKNKGVKANAGGSSQSQVGRDFWLKGGFRWRRVEKQAGMGAWVPAGENANSPGHGDPGLWAGKRHMKTMF